MQDSSYSNQPPSYEQVHRPELLWQPQYMESYDNKLKSVDELKHLGELGMKPPHRFRTHQEDPLARCYNKLDPNVLVFASNSVEVHRFLSQRHTHVVSRTTACIYNPCDIVDIDSWCKTALFAFRSMPAAPDRSFNENRTPGSAPSYRWYTKIQVACQNVRSALVAWQSCDEELDLEFRSKFKEEDLPNQI